MDEFAHTNAPGSRNAKRYEDIDEILDAGIDVVSTVNVQHLESLNDSVRELTGVRVRETFPDSILDEADEVVLVDLSPGGCQAADRQGVSTRSGSTRRWRTSSASRNLGAARAGAARGGRGRRAPPRRRRCSRRSGRGRSPSAMLALVSPSPVAAILAAPGGPPSGSASDIDVLGAPPGSRASAEERRRSQRSGASRRPRRALPGGGGRRPGRDRPARRRRPALDLRVRRHARRAAPGRDPARLARRCA